MTTATFTDVRQNFKRYCDMVEEDAAPVIITRTKGENVVLVSQDEWDSIQETLYVMSRPEMMEGLRRSQEDIDAGRVTSWDSLEDFKAAMRADV